MAAQLNLQEESVISPVEPAEHTYRIQCSSAENKATMRTVCRRQFSMIIAYTFTDYRSQGKTLFAVVVVIVSPTGGLSLFNLYVAITKFWLIDD